VHSSVPAAGLDGLQPGRRLGRGGPDRVGPLARPNPVDFLFFRNMFQCKKTNPGNEQKMFRGTKNTQKITKIPGKFLEID
jgi:hypothetical protein